MSFLSRFSSKSKKSSVRKKEPSVFSPPTELSLSLPSPSFTMDTFNGADTPDSKSPNSTTPSWIKLDGDDAREDKREREAREQKKMDRARFGIASGRALIDLCGDVIRERGSTTLGLFRPYRLAESPAHIRCLALLFIAYALELDTAGAPVDNNLLPKEIFGAKGRPNAKREAFLDELRFAGVHDVVALLKWGLRHLVYPTGTSFSGDSSTAPLAFWTSFTALDTQDYATLLSVLPSASQELLSSILPLLSSLSAHSESSGLSPHKLCFTLGLYFFGLGRREGPWGTWEDVYTDWRAAGQVLEDVLRCWLLSQRGLPRRLMEVRDGQVGVERSVVALMVEIESQGEWPLVPGLNDQETGKTGLRGVKRNTPLEVLTAALESVEPGQEATEWDQVVTVLKSTGGEPIDLLSEETQQTLRLLKLDSHTVGTGTTKRRKSFSMVSSSIGTRGHHSRTEEEVVTTLPTMVQSLAIQFASKSVVNFTHTTTPSSWSEFTEHGFSGQPPLDVLDEFGLLLPAPPSETLVRRPGQWTQAQPPQSPSSGTISKFGSTGSTVAKKPQHRLLGCSFVQLDGDFQDTWLDTLVDEGACGAWPSFVLSKLQPAFAKAAKSSYLLVAQRLVPFAVPSPTTLRKNAIAEMTLSSKWNRRISSLFTSSSRGSPMVLTKEFAPPFLGSHPASPTSSLSFKRKKSSISPSAPKKWEQATPLVPATPAILPARRASENSNVFVEEPAIPNLVPPVETRTPALEELAAAAEEVSAPVTTESSISVIPVSLEAMEPVEDGADRRMSPETLQGRDPEAAIVDVEETDKPPNEMTATGDTTTPGHDSVLFTESAMSAESPTNPIYPIKVVHSASPMLMLSSPSEVSEMLPSSMGPAVLAFAEPSPTTDEHLVAHNLDPTADQPSTPGGPMDVFVAEATASMASLEQSSG